MLMGGPTQYIRKEEGLRKSVIGKTLIKVVNIN